MFFLKQNITVNITIAIVLVCSQWHDFTLFYFIPRFDAITFKKIRRKHILSIQFYAALKLNIQKLNRINLDIFWLPAVLKKICHAYFIGWEILLSPFFRQICWEIPNFFWFPSPTSAAWNSASALGIKLKRFPTRKRMITQSFCSWD